MLKKLSLFTSFVMEVVYAGICQWEYHSHYPVIGWHWFLIKLCCHLLSNCKAHSYFSPLELVTCSKRKCTYDLPSCHILAILFHKAQLCQHSTLYLFISKATNTVSDVGLYIGVRTFHSTMHKAAVFLSFCLFLAYFLMLVGVRIDQCGFC